MNILKFEQFKDEIYEGKTYKEAPVNEGIGKFFKNLWDKVKGGSLKKIGKYFVGKGGWLANLKTMQDSHSLPKGVQVYTYDSLPSNLETITPEEAGVQNDESVLRGYIIKEGNESSITESEEQYVQLGAYKDMPNVDASELKQTISDAYSTKANLMIWGAPGIGKTEILKEVAKDHGANVIVVILSLMEPTDAIGLPEIEEITGKDGKTSRRTVTRLPIWYPQDNYGIDGESQQGGIMFLDELNRANRAVMNSLLTLVQDRKIDIANYTMPDQWVVVAACNREEDDPGNLEEIGSALGNRFQHINYTPTSDDWIEWASTKSASGKQNVIDDIVAFIEFNKDYLHMLDTEAASELWASPRSWTNASRQISDIQDLRHSKSKPFSDKDIESIIARNVSPSVAKEFMAFLKVAKSYPLDKIDLAYTDPTNAPSPSKGTKVGRVDTSLALLAAVAYARKDKDISDDEFLNLIKYADGLTRAELAMPFIQLFFKLRPEFKTRKYLSMQEVSNFLNKY